MTSKILQSYKRIIENTERNVQSGEYLNPKRIIQDIHRELSDLVLLELVKEEEVQNFRERLNDLLKLV